MRAVIPWWLYNVCIANEFIRARDCYLTQVIKIISYSYSFVSSFLNYNFAIRNSSEIVKQYSIRYNHAFAGHRAACSVQQLLLSATTTFKKFLRPEFINENKKFGWRKFCERGVKLIVLM